MTRERACTAAIDIVKSSAVVQMVLRDNDIFIRSPYRLRESLFLLADADKYAEPMTCANRR